MEKAKPKKSKVKETKVIICYKCKGVAFQFGLCSKCFDETIEDEEIHFKACGGKSLYQ